MPSGRKTGVFKNVAPALVAGSCLDIHAQQTGHKAPGYGQNGLSICFGLFFEAEVCRPRYAYFGFELQAEA
jgi:hypothetical protein